MSASLSRSEWSRVNEVFHAALAHDSSARGEFVRRECADSAAVAREVLSLLASHEGAAQFIETPITVAADLFDEPAHEADRPLPVGSTLGPYTIVGEAGAGGMGVVYVAQDARLGRQVALKMLPATLADSDEARARLRREARAAAALQHPGIATVYALEEFDKGLCIASEYVRGETLGARIERGPVPLAEVLSIGRAIAVALAAAHDCGVVHRDLKPENVMLTSEGGVKILDFGLAQMLPAAGAPPASRVTREGMVVGTIAYMSPGQLRGQPVDARADIFALGVVLFELAAGRHPFAGDSDISTAARILESAPAPAALPPGLARVIARCLAKDRDGRYRSAREVVAALDALSSESGGPPIVTPTSRPSSTSRWWWQVHQSVVAIVYALMLYPLWIIRADAPAVLEQAVFFIGLVAVSAAVAIRLHLAFTARVLPDESAAQRARSAVWLHVTDAVVIAVFLAGAALALGHRTGLATLLVAVAVGSFVAATLIEPATTRAAWGQRP